MLVWMRVRLQARARELEGSSWRAVAGSDGGGDGSDLWRGVSSVTLMRAQRSIGLREGSWGPCRWLLAWILWWWFGDVVVLPLKLGLRLEFCKR